MLQVGIKKQWPSFEEYLCGANDVKCFDVLYLQDWLREQFSVSEIYILRFELLQESQRMFVEHALRFLDRSGHSELSIVNSNSKIKVGEQVFLRKRPWLELKLRRLGGAVPSCLKVSWLRDLWRFFLSVVTRFRKGFIIDKPNETTISLIEEEYEMTIRHYYGNDLL
jgi:hypothetical protein